MFMKYIAKMDTRGCCWNVLSFLIATNQNKPGGGNICDWLNYEAMKINVLSLVWCSEVLTDKMLRQKKLPQLS